MSGRVSMKEPVCLVESDSEGNLHVNPASQDILNQIDQHVVVVAVVGLYRTGKSYLMNKLAGKNKGFALGSTSQSKTKGIWMWCVPHPLKADLTLVLLDTEGLGDVEKGDNKNNIWIFSLAVLLSSTLVYNSMGNIDNKALENLHYVTELTEHIKTKSGQTEDDEAEYMRFFPSFVWTVRDFTLELELDGKPITADEYLEYALKLKPGTSKKIQEYNLPRECLRKYFTPRKCFVFDFPTTGKKVKRLGELTDADLEPDFVQQSNDFCTHIFTNSKTKTLKGGILVTGRLLGNLAETYVATIRSGQIPCLDNAVLALSEIENSGAVERSRVFYQKNNAVLVPLEEKGSSAYAVPGGYNKYCSDIQKLTEEYKNTKGKGVMAEEVFKMYLDGLTNLGQIILATDKSLSEAEQRAKEAEAKAELAKQEHHAAQELMMLQKRLQEGQERTYQQLINDLMEKMEVDMRQASAEYQSGAKLEVRHT